VSTSCKKRRQRSKKEIENDDSDTEDEEVESDEDKDGVENIKDDEWETDSGSSDGETMITDDES